MVGEFVQVGPDGSKTQGQVYLQKPGRVRFEYDDPRPIELIADGSSLVVRDRRLATQDLYPLVADAAALPARRQGRSAARHQCDRHLFGRHFLDRRDRGEAGLGGTHKLMLMFGAKDLTLRQWTVTDPQGFDTTVAVYNLDMTKKPDPGLFKINYERRGSGALTLISRAPRRKVR